MTVVQQKPINDCKILSWFLVSKRVYFHFLSLGTDVCFNPWIILRILDLVLCSLIRNSLSFNSNLNFMQCQDSDEKGKMVLLLGLKDKPSLSIDLRMINPAVFLKNPFYSKNLVLILTYDASQSFHNHLKKTSCQSILLNH